MTDILTHAVSLLNDRFLGYVLMAALLFAGLYFTFATRFVQFVRPKEMLRLMIGGEGSSKEKGHISPFQRGRRPAEADPVTAVNQKRNHAAAGDRQGNGVPLGRQLH